jgi:hypothetical protein
VESTLRCTSKGISRVYGFPLEEIKVKEGVLAQDLLAKV